MRKQSHPVATLEATTPAIQGRLARFRPANSSRAAAAGNAAGHASHCSTRSEGRRIPTIRKGRSVEFMTIARDAVAIIVHKDNPLTDIDNALVRDIYGGKRTTWDDGKPITVINKEAGRATLIVFEEFFGLADAIRKDAVIIGANGQAIAAVAADPASIAYVSVADCLAAVENGTPIKILKLNGVVPSVPTILSGDYKLSRPLNLAYLRSEKDQVEPVLRLMRDEGAVAKIKERNFVPAIH